ncbi:MAG TPA: carbon-nitrogen hydrolase family protein [Tepidisphaeraceae bacterium]|nr:carbon-nitrogen hydrolase family protein [Tepidisphaeraceae bacterium]
MKRICVFFPILYAATLCSAGVIIDQPVGRPVRVLSLSFANEPLDVICHIIDREAAKGVDLIVLPETWRGQNDTSMETLEGPTITAMSALAKKYNTYIVSPIDRKDSDRRVNSAVLLDRHGKVVFVYDKVFPYWSEFDHKKKVDVGLSVPVYQADFGRIGFAICFDVNFPEVWKRLADEGAELVVWPSAYSAGTTLQAHALNNHYYIVSSTGARDCVVYDITGEQILYQKSKDINITHVTLDLDRGIYHENFNLDKRAKLLKEHEDDVELEKVLDRESWFVLRARRPGVSARALARQYGMEELRDYIDRSRREIDAMRGWSFEEKVDRGEQR